MTIDETIEFAEEQAKWIPVTDELPPKGTEVLVTYIYLGNMTHYVSIAERFGNEPDVDWVAIDDEYKLNLRQHKVIAWQPLPQPYKEDSE